MLYTFEERMMKVYLSGPMSNLPQFNFPAFTAAAHDLRNEGWTVISPHETDSEEVQKEAVASADGALINGKIAGATWGDLLAKDVKIVADSVDGIVFLPNWEDSKGARLEAYVGLLCGHKFFSFPSKKELSPEYIAGVCAAKWMPEEVKKLALAS